MAIEREISDFMLRFSKFEFFLISQNRDLAHIGPTEKITGVNWNQLGKLVETKYSFTSFNFADSGFQMFQTTAPQFLVMSKHGVRWQGDDDAISSWEMLFTRGLAQLRNNIAHGSKSLIPAPFTAQRTQEFIAAAEALIAFVTADVLGHTHWEEPILFH